MIVHDIFTKRQTFIALHVSELVKMHKEKAYSERHESASGQTD